MQRRWKENEETLKHITGRKKEQGNMKAVVFHENCNDNKSIEKGLICIMQTA